MEDYRKQAKIDALNRTFPGKSCGNLRCEELCAEAYDAAKAMRLDPADVIRRTIERELCCPQADSAREKCRFGFMPPSESIALGHEGKKQDKEDIIIHVFHTGVNECEKCQKLDGTRISPEDWADEERMKKKGFWKQKNGEYLPHPHCKCHWEEEKEVYDGKSFRKQVQSGVKLNRTRDNTFEGKEREFRVAGAPGRLGKFGGGETIDGFDNMLNKLEKNNQPHSIGLLRIIGHGSPGTADVGLVFQDSFSDLLNHDTPSNRKKIARLRKMLSNHAMVELRMCNVGLVGKKPEENGPVFAQKLANLLWCRVKVYLELVDPYGWSKERFGRRAKYEIYQPGI